MHFYTSRRSDEFRVKEFIHGNKLRDNHHPLQHFSSSFQVLTILAIHTTTVVLPHTLFSIHNRNSTLTCTMPSVSVKANKQQAISRGGGAKAELKES